MTKAEDAMTVPVGPRHRLGDLRQVAEGLAVEAKPSSKIMTRSSLPLLLTHEQRAGLQVDPVSGLRRAAVETSADAILFPRAKDPSDRFVETAERVRLEPTGQHFHQEPAWKMGRRFAAEVDAPLTAQPIEIEALKVGDDRQNRGIERQRSSRRLPPPDASPPSPS